MCMSVRPCLCILYEKLRLYCYNTQYRREGERVCVVCKSESERDGGERVKLIDTYIHTHVNMCVIIHLSSFFFIYFCSIF